MAAMKTTESDRSGPRWSPSQADDETLAQFGHLARCFPSLAGMPSRPGA
jgi:hypothetical protein